LTKASRYVKKISLEEPQIKEGPPILKPYFTGRIVLLPFDILILIVLKEMNEKDEMQVTNARR
jgi:hypothetical protein